MSSQLIGSIPCCSPCNASSIPEGCMLDKQRKNILFEKRNSHPLGSTLKRYQNQAHTPCFHWCRAYSHTRLVTVTSLSQLNTDENRHLCPASQHHSSKPAPQPELTTEAAGPARDHIINDRNIGIIYSSNQVILLVLV